MKKFNQIFRWVRNVYFLSVSLKFLSTCLLFVNSILLARLLGVDDVGIYAYYISIAGLISAIGNVALPQILVRETARFWDIGDVKMLKNIWTWAVLAFLAAFASSTLVISFVIWAFTDNQLKSDIYVILLTSAIFGISGFLFMFSAAVRGSGLRLVGQLPTLLLQPISFTVFLALLFVFSGRGTSVTLALFANFSSMIFALVVSIAVLLFFSPLKQPAQQKSEQERPALWNSLFYHGTVSIFQYFSANTSVVLLVIFCTNADAGIFRIAVTLSALVLVPLQAINATINPRIAKHFYNGETSQMLYMLKHTLFITVTLSGFLAFLLLVFGRSVIENTYGPEFLSAYLIVCTLVLGNFLSSAFGPVGSILNMTGNEKETTKAVVLSSIFACALNFALIPWLGAIGGAIATVLATLFWNARMWYVVRHRLGLKCALIDYV